MKMWQPDRLVTGPRAATERDIAAMNRLFSEAFTDRYRRDGLVGVRVPQLNPLVWRYALRDAGAGAMLWQDERDELVAFNVAHASGSEGWMGPLAVRSDRQSLGVGKAIVTAAMDWVREQGVRTLGLETMPRTVENIGFYSQLGFLPGHLTVTMTNDVKTRSVRGRFERLSEASPSERKSWLAACATALGHAVPGHDHTRELTLTNELNLGDTLIVTMGEAVSGLALYHSVPLAEARPADELRVLKLFAASADAFDKLVVALEITAAKLKLRRVAIRCQTAYRDAYDLLIQRGYRVRWTDLRMCLRGFPEPMAPDGAVLFSNWEI